MEPSIETERLVIRPWRETDVPEALAIYGDEEVTRWLTPAMSWVPDEATMRSVLRKWREEDVAPVSHQAVELRGTRQVIGGVSLVRLAPWEDVEIGWQLARSAWGHGYASEAGEAMARWSLHRAGVEELFALVGAENARAAATARRIGMEWIGETDQYHHRRLELFRLRHSDLAYCESCEDAFDHDVGTVRSVVADGRGE
ncbi:GNAT family N-acetyltransferase [Kribbella sancticallisti]|uniref:GNAT family N-acetyltransferase n=1 Tax=Kribbella sancticallisti TaxID=460087 RepID=A0ABP4PPM7_9ACTN